MALDSNAKKNGQLAMLVPVVGLQRVTDALQSDLIERFLTSSPGNPQLI